MTSKETNDKVRRKEVPVTAGASTTIEKKKDNPSWADSTYKTTVDLEEAEAVSRNGEKDMNLFMDFCKKIRSQLLLLGTETNMEQPQINDIKKEISLIFIMLKKLNRLEKYRLKNSRTTLQTTKQKLDTFNLQLQNLRYEVYHLKKEVVRCLQFKSKDEDIDLVDETTFFNEAPETISRPETTKQDTHQLKLARLEWELKQRKEQSELCQKVAAENESVALDINKKRSQLDNLAPLLKQILAVSKPLQENLSYPENPARLQYKLAHLLPEPLYCLFVQIDAYKQACCPDIEISIQGSEEEAEKLIKTLSDLQQNQVESDSETEEMVENNERGDNNSKSSSKHHRHHHHHRHSKSRLSTSNTGEEIKVVDTLEDKRQKLIQKHPLFIELIFKSKSSSNATTAPPLSTLSFYYYINLHIVTVFVTSSSVVMLSKCNYYEILANLFPEDIIFNETTPNVLNHYQLKQCGLTFETSKFGFPYIWVQRLAGLDFLKSTISAGGSLTDVKVPTDPSVSQACVPVTIKKLKKRFKSSQELSTLLVQLENGQLLGPHSCNLISWQNITWSQYESTEFTNHIIQNEFVNSSNWLFFKTILSRSSAKLSACIAIHYDYPIIPPIISVQIDVNKVFKHSGNDEAVRDIEKELNAEWKDISATFGTSSILRAQMECLASCFDIYLECLNVKEYPRKRTFVKPFRGRNRSYPYKCVSKSEALFTQR